MQLNMMYAGLKIDMITIPILVWAVYIGFAIGILSVYYNKAILGKAIRAIIEKSAFSAETAMTAEALGFARNPFIMRSVKKGVLSRYIASVSGQEGDPLRFYIAEEDRIRAEMRYAKEGTDLYVVILALIIFAVIAFVAARYLPQLLDLAGDIVS